MASKDTLDALAMRIRLSIEKLGFHRLCKDDIEELCNQNTGIIPEEQSLLITNFASAYGLKVRVSDDVKSVIFHNSG